MKMIYRLTIIVASSMATFAEPPAKLVEAWKTDPILEVPECVLYHAPDDILFVSNIVGKPADKDGTGFISRIGTDGNIHELKWATGLSAPKGMAISGDKLYVTDIDELVEIELATGKISKRYPAANAVFLNDCAAKDGIVYVGDSSEENGCIYRLLNGTLTPWLKQPQVHSPNGLHIQGNNLLIGEYRNGQLLSANLKTGEITSITRTDSGIDGLKPCGDGHYLTSDWAGRTTLLTHDGKNHILMDTSAANINAADFEYIPELQLLLIPTFFDNCVAAYTVEKTGATGKAPAIQALDQDGNPWHLKDHLGTKPIVVYFYPAAMTGGCTKQACSYRDYIKSEEEPDLIIVGISGDTPENLKHFQQAEGLNFPLLSDPDGTIAKAFGVPVRAGAKTIRRTIDGNEVNLTRTATTSRWTFIISPEGNIIYKNDQVKAAEDLRAVLEFLKK